MAAFKITDQTLRIATLVTGALAVLATLATFALDLPSWIPWATMGAGVLALAAGAWFAAQPERAWLGFATPAFGLAAGIVPAWASWGRTLEGWVQAGVVVGYVAILASIATLALVGWREYEDWSGNVPVTKA